MPSRRDALKVLAGVPLCGALVGAASKDGYWYLTPDICTARGLDSAKARVFLNEIDVTDRYKVLACDDRAGYIVTLARDHKGEAHMDGATGGLAKAWLYGQVRVAFNA